MNQCQRFCNLDFIFQLLVEAPVVWVCAGVEDGLDVRDDVRAWGRLAMGSFSVDSAGQCNGLALTFPDRAAQ